MSSSDGTRIGKQEIRNVNKNPNPCESKKMSSCQIVSSTTAATTTSETFVDVPEMSVVLPAGKYAVFFSGTAQSSKSDAVCSIAIFNGNTQKDESYRELFANGENHANNFKVSMHTQDIVASDGIKPIRVCWKTTKGNFRTFNRSLLIMKATD